MAMADGKITMKAYLNIERSVNMFIIDLERFLRQMYKTLVNKFCLILLDCLAGVFNWFYGAVTYEIQDS